MRFREFLEIAESGGDLDPDAAERAARATLTTLAERLSPGQARDLLQRLPPEMKPWLDDDRHAERFDVGEFLRRVAEREAVDAETAERHVRAVFFALGRAVGPREIADVASELPGDFEPLIAEAQHRFFEAMPAEEFAARVAARTGLGTDAALQVTESVLEALAEAVAGGDVDDLVPRLPLALHDPLRRGRTTTGGVAGRMPLDRFLDRVAELGDADPLDATDHARAVIATLHEAIGDEEYFTTTVRLPPDYDVLSPGA